MKKTLLWITSLVLCFSMCFTGCQQDVKEKNKDDQVKDTEPVTFLAEVLEIGRNHVLVEPLDGENERNSSNQISFSTRDLEDIGAEEGDVVEITYDGLIMESYPAQIHASRWKIHEKACTGNDVYDIVDEKPVIYLYPEAETEVSVKLTTDGELTCTYPAYHDGWMVTASPDGTLADASGQTYRYLFWEATSKVKYDFSKGFCVKGSETAAFLEYSLAELGLNRQEANEFIVYWLPRMEVNPYNIISFQTDAYTESAQLEIIPTPDTLIRVFMAWYPSDAYVEIPSQVFSAPDRTGFTVIEWGGSKIIP